MHGTYAYESLSMCVECKLVKSEWMSNEFVGKTGGGRRRKKIVQWEWYSGNGIIEGVMW